MNLFNADLFFSLHILQISDPRCHFLLSEKNVKPPVFSLQLFLNPDIFVLIVNDCSYFGIVFFANKRRDFFMHISIFVSSCFIPTFYFGFLVARFFESFFFSNLFCILMWLIHYIMR